jgi:hypothetical protein
MTKRREPNADETSKQAYGERRLWTAVIVMAVEDWRNGTLGARQRAQEFLFEDDDNFTRVCDGAGLEPGSLRVKLLKICGRVNMKGPSKQLLAA